MKKIIAIIGGILIVLAALAAVVGFVKRKIKPRNHNKL